MSDRREFIKQALKGAAILTVAPSVLAAGEPKRYIAPEDKFPQLLPLARSEDPKTTFLCWDAVDPKLAWFGSEDGSIMSWRAHPSTLHKYSMPVHIFTPVGMYAYHVPSRNKNYDFLIHTKIIEPGTHIFKDSHSIDHSVRAAHVKFPDHVIPEYRKRWFVYVTLPKNDPCFSDIEAHRADKYAYLRYIGVPSIATYDMPLEDRCEPIYLPNRQYETTDTIREMMKEIA
jgi:hypothetical protein